MSSLHQTCSVLYLIVSEPDLVRQALHEGLLAGSGDDDSVRFVRAIVEDKVSLSLRYPCLINIDARH